MNNLFALTVFLLFVLSGFLAAHRKYSSPEQRKRAVSGFLMVACSVSLLAGLMQRDWWPFSCWPLVAGELETRVVHPRLVAIDSSGQEVALDYRAVQPFEFDELMSWLNGPFEGLDDDARGQAFAQILTFVHAAQDRMTRSESPGYFQRYLGPATAPYFLLHPALWRCSSFPPDHIRGLRFYREHWNLGDRQRTLKRVLVYEFLEAPARE